MTMTSLRTVLAAAMTLGAISATNAQEQPAENGWQTKLKNCARVALGSDVFEKFSAQSYNGHIGSDSITFVKKADGGAIEADEARVTLVLDKPGTTGDFWIQAASGSAFSTIINTDKISFEFNGEALKITDELTFGALGLNGGHEASQKDIQGVTKTVETLKQSIAACITSASPARGLGM